MDSAPQLESYYSGHPNIVADRTAAIVELVVKLASSELVRELTFGRSYNRKK